MATPIARAILSLIAIVTAIACSVYQISFFVASHKRVIQLTSSASHDGHPHKTNEPYGDATVFNDVLNTTDHELRGDGDEDYRNSQDGKSTNDRRHTRLSLLVLFINEVELIDLAPKWSSWTGTDASSTSRIVAETLDSGRYD